MNDEIKKDIALIVEMLIANIIYCVNTNGKFLKEGKLASEAVNKLKLIQEKYK